MAPQHNLTLVAGDTLTLQVTWQDSDGEPVNLGGYTAQMQVRSKPNGDIWASSTGGSPSLTLTLGGAAGTIDIVGTVSQTTQAVGYWELQVTQGGAVTTLVGGLFTVVQEVTA